MTAMAMVMRGNNESMVRKQFYWLIFSNISTNKKTRRGLLDIASTVASELTNERLAYEILFVFILKRFNNSRQSKLHYRAVKCEVTV